MNLILLNNICQILIPIISAMAIYLISRTDKSHRYGFIIGLVGQPLWLFSTYYTKQYGLFALSIIYTGIFINGIYNRFIKKEVQN